MATFATHASSQGCPAGRQSEINTRIVQPRPVDHVSNASCMGVVYIDTNSLSRKYVEIQTAINETGYARASLLYYDREGNGYVAIRGNVTICSAEEARQQ